jgi:hypothetical protein
MRPDREMSVHYEPAEPRKSWGWFWLVILGLLVFWAAAIVFVVAMAGEARAHDAPSGLWSYPYSCCSGNAATGDCQEISSGTVRERPDGYHVILNPGDHRLVKERLEVVIPYTSKRPSPDGGYHICTMQSSPFWRCFFAPEGGV